MIKTRRNKISNTTFTTSQLYCLKSRLYLIDKDLLTLVVIFLMSVKKKLHSGCSDSGLDYCVDHLQYEMHVSSSPLHHTVYFCVCVIPNYKFSNIPIFLGGINEHNLGMVSQKSCDLEFYFIYKQASWWFT